MACLTHWGHVFKNLICNSYKAIWTYFSMIEGFFPIAGSDILIGGHESEQDVLRYSCKYLGPIGGSGIN